ncbi:MAG TPA: hypothetical protein VKK31_02275 [Thermoanaerobaculia bacterium]|nr:hypothetical protein [Thermoanaerobaculia bacterium]
MTALSLPPQLDVVDISAWESLSPEDLIQDPARVYGLPREQAAARALRYARSGPTGSYDEIGFRMFAATPAKGELPLQTMPGMRLERGNKTKAKPSDPVAAVLDEQQKLRHRLIDLPSESGRFSYRVEGKLIHLIPVSGDPDEGQVWTFPLSAPLKLLQNNAVESDAPLLLTQRYRVDVPGSFWLPVTALIQYGRFRRMQDGRDTLEHETQAGHFFCFVSHRWLTPVEPDPDGVQAAFLAWQLFSHLCEAVRVAQYRGLRQPRTRSTALGFAIGITGSELAEALIVNVLRMRLDDAAVEPAWDEARSVENLTQDYGTTAAASDAGLVQLRQLLADRPLLASLLSRVYVWYDYACLPQTPRTPEDETLFRQGIENLVPIQVLGHTVVLLDEAEDYLSRGWCTLEALVADTEAVSMQLLVGSTRRSARADVAEHYFNNLLEDRPHLVWRAVLDTEVFGVQTPDQCLARLNLAVTDERDIPFIYRGLLTLRAPSKIHVDASELFTGVYPLPVVDGYAIAPLENGRLVRDAEVPDAKTLDWTHAVRLASGWSPDRTGTGTDPFLALAVDGTSPAPRCHGAIVASCEGEAVLLSRWLLAHCEQLETSLGVVLQSVSWLAADIAPVGHFVHGALQAIMVDAPVWVIVATGARLTFCGVTGALIEARVNAGKKTWQLAIDSPADNLRPVSGAGSKTRKIALPDGGFPLHPGGLFRASLLDQLLESPDRERSPR